MSIYEYDEEGHMEVLKEEQYQRGVEDGIQQGINEGIKEGECWNIWIFRRSKRLV